MRGLLLLPQAGMRGRDARQYVKEEQAAGSIQAVMRGKGAREHAKAAAKVFRSLSPNLSVS